MPYRAASTEVPRFAGAKGKVCSPPFTGKIHNWPKDGKLDPCGIFLSCGDSAETGLPGQSIDLIVTDPPFFDNVHYSELADFFHAWQQLGNAGLPKSTRHPGEVQDKNPSLFAAKLGA